MKCELCNGTGKISTKPSPEIGRLVDCPDCRGTGIVDDFKKNY
jgi:DnaJ-class molecular chaperone